MSLGFVRQIGAPALMSQGTDISGSFGKTHRNRNPVRPCVNAGSGSFGAAGKLSSAWPLGFVRQIRNRRKP